MTNGLTTIYTKSGRPVTVGSQYASSFKGFLDDLEASGYPIDSLGGFAKRNIAGTNTPSFHSLGAAIDINPSENPVTYGSRQTNMPSNIEEMAQKWGLGWGGDWRHKKDPMHFSAARQEGGTFGVNRYAGLGAVAPTAVATGPSLATSAPTTGAPPMAASHESTPWSKAGDALARLFGNGQTADKSAGFAPQQQADNSPAFVPVMPSPYVSPRQYPSLATVAPPAQPQQNGAIRILQTLMG